MKNTKTLKTKVELDIEAAIANLEEALHHEELSDLAWSKDYRLLSKKLKVLKKTAKKLEKIGRQRQKLLEKGLQNSDNLV